MFPAQVFFADNALSGVRSYFFAADIAKIEGCFFCHWYLLFHYSFQFGLSVLCRPVQKKTILFFQKISDWGFMKMPLERMQDLGLGKGVPAQAKRWGWKHKREELYKPLGVWERFNQVREKLAYENGKDRKKAHLDAQEIVDAYILEVNPDIKLSEEDEKVDKIEKVEKKKEGFSGYKKKDFGDFDAEIEPIRDLTWIYNHIAVMDVKPEDAPSPGAFAHLKFIQKNQVNQVDFFTKVYPRIIPSKSQIETLNKFNDDGRSDIDLLDRLLTESKESQE